MFEEWLGFWLNRAFTGTKECWSGKKRKKKKKHKLNTEDYVYELAKDLSPGCNLSKSFEGLPQRGKGWARIYRYFCNKSQVVRTSKDYC